VIPFSDGPFDVPEVNLVAVMKDGKRIPIQVVVDTGAGHALSLHVDEDAGFALPEDAFEFTVGRSMWGKVYGHIGRVDCLCIGKYSLENVLTTFTSGEREGPAQCGKNGNLGNDALQRFHVFFDYANTRMILEPNSCYKDPFEFENRAGIQLAKEDGRGFRVGRVVPDSPADDSGLLVDDMVIRINGRPAEQVGMDELIELISKRGEKLTLAFLRSGEVREVSMTLRDLI
jgi:hypothetical protein